MYHRLPHKYKEFTGQENIIVGKGEIVWSESKHAWVAPNGKVIRDRNEAIRLATLINELYTKASIQQATKRNSHR